MQLIETLKVLSKVVGSVVDRYTSRCNSFKNSGVRNPTTSAARPSETASRL